MQISENLVEQLAQKSSDSTSGERVTGLLEGEDVPLYDSSGYDDSHEYTRVDVGGHVTTVVRELSAAERRERRLASEKAQWEAAIGRTRARLQAQSKAVFAAAQQTNAALQAEEPVMVSLARELADFEEVLLRRETWGTA